MDKIVYYTSFIKKFGEYQANALDAAHGGTIEDLRFNAASATQLAKNAGNNGLISANEAQELIDNLAKHILDFLIVK